MWVVGFIPGDKLSISLGLRPCYRTYWNSLPLMTWVKYVDQKTPLPRDYLRRSLSFEDRKAKPVINAFFAKRITRNLRYGEVPAA
jgi:hypothetical protein